MVRVRFAPSPTGYLHIGSARTFIFNWLYARRHNGTMVLRIDDTDSERNTRISEDSIFDGLRWLGLDWDEQYRQSARLELHAAMAARIFEAGHAYRDFTPQQEAAEKAHASGAAGTWLCNPGMRELPRAESDRRAAAGEPFVLRFRVPRGAAREVQFTDEVYGAQSREADGIEDFALLRSNGLPTYHMASCADDVDLRITHIVRGQDHLTNTFKHVLIFEALGVAPPRFAHLPLLIAPGGAKLSKRRHGPVVSVTTYRDAGFLPRAYVNFLCLLGWSPKDDREMMPIGELTTSFGFEGINRSNAVVNFTDGDPIDPKALWLNSQHLYALPAAELAALLEPWAAAAGWKPAPGQLLQIAPLIRERMKTLRDFAAVADFFFVEPLPDYPPAELVPQKGDAAMARVVLERARQALAGAEFTHEALEQALRAAAAETGVKAGQMFQPVRVAVCGRKVAPPLFETLAVLGRELALSRIGRALALLGS